MRRIQGKKTHPRALQGCCRRPGPPGKCMQIPVDAVIRKKEKGWRRKQGHEHQVQWGRIKNIGLVASLSLQKKKRKREKKERINDLLGGRFLT
jgi:hypothetical protein